MMMTQSPTSPGGPGGGASVDSDKLVDEYTYRLAPGDLIDVKFPYHPEENERVPVRPDGRIGLQVIGDVMAAGLTVKELEQVVVEKSSTTLRDPVVSIVIAAARRAQGLCGRRGREAGIRPLPRWHDAAAGHRRARRIRGRRQYGRDPLHQPGGRSRAISKT